MNNINVKTDYIVNKNKETLNITQEQKISKYLVKKDEPNTNRVSHEHNNYYSLFSYQDNDNKNMEDEDEDLIEILKEID